MLLIISKERERSNLQQEPLKGRWRYHPSPANTDE